MTATAPDPTLAQYLAIDLVKEDRAFAAQRRQRARERYLAGMIVVFEGFPQIEQVYLDFRDNVLASCVRTVPERAQYLIFIGSVASELKEEEREVARLAKRFHGSLSSTRGALGTSSVSFETVAAVFPMARSGTVCLPREQWIKACRCLLEQPDKVLDEHFLLSMQAPKARAKSHFPRL